MTTLIIILNTLFCFLSDATSVRKKMEWNVKPTLGTFLVCSSCINRSNNGRHSFPSLLVILCVNPHLALLHHLVKSWGFSFFSERERERISTFCLPASHFGLRGPSFTPPSSCLLFLSASSLKGLSPFYQFIFYVIPSGTAVCSVFPRHEWSIYGFSNRSLHRDS